MRNLTNEDTFTSVKQLQVVMDGHTPKLGFLDENKKFVVLGNFACERAANSFLEYFRQGGGIVTKGDYNDE